MCVVGSFMHGGLGLLLLDISILFHYCNDDLVSKLYTVDNSNDNLMIIFVTL